MKNIILIAPPAAGKGTLSDILSNRYNIPHISTGELLRERSYVDDEFGIDLLCMMKSGKLVDDDTVINVLKERISSSDCKNGYLLDGFPRNINQAYSLDNILSDVGLSIDYVIYLDIDYNTALERITGRMSCPKCGAIYNKYNMLRKPKVEGICDRCSSPLITRADDNEDTFKQRYDSYIECTLPVIEYYRQKNKLAEFDGRLESEQIADMVSDILMR